jgi:hypothetical protein
MSEHTEHTKKANDFLEHLKKTGVVNSDVTLDSFRKGLEKSANSMGIHTQWTAVYDSNKWLAVLPLE